ncbi:hypothetical protein ID866_8946 [Astraeus odoratus]|nr:hypothetical protein ID866_8946 [Astraeus odoratus]
MLGRLVLTTTALLGAASAQLTITNPSSSSWWGMLTFHRILVYSPIANSDPTILVSPIAIISVQENYDCSKQITQQQSSQPAATGYTILLANTLNSSDVYATSDSFEIKAQGSSYPATTSSAASATSSGSSPSASSGSSSGALIQYIPAGLGMAAALAMGIVFA